MQFEEYISEINRRSKGKALSDVKMAILNRLWSGEWVMSPEILELTGQKYFDRRIRELRDETGCDLETGRHFGQHAYRLLSPSLSAGNKRAYLTQKQKADLFKRSAFTCAVCGRKFDPNDGRVQADHKIPLIRSGSHAENNWQVLCVECNVSKRSACAECEMKCEECPWAFPEKLGNRLVVNLPVSTSVALRDVANSRGKRPDEIAWEAIAKFLKSEQ